MGDERGGGGLERGGGVPAQRDMGGASGIVSTLKEGWGAAESLRLQSGDEGSELGTQRGLQIPWGL